MDAPPTTQPSPQAEPARFAVLVTAARTQRQMSRHALAEQAGISLKALEDLERGYPVPQEIASAVCRNLDLPEPSLDTSPLVRLALRLRESRGQARLSRAQLARKVGVSTPIIPRYSDQIWRLDWTLSANPATADEIGHQDLRLGGSIFRIHIDNAGSLEFVCTIAARTLVQHLPSRFYCSHRAQRFSGESVK